MKRSFYVGPYDLPFPTIHLNITPNSAGDDPKTRESMTIVIKLHKVDWGKLTEIEMTCAKGMLNDAQGLYKEVRSPLDSILSLSLLICLV